MSVLKWRDRNNQPERLTLCLKSRHCSLSSVQPANFPAKVFRCSEWRKRLCNKSHIYIINLHEQFAKGYDSPWTTCICHNRKHTGYTCSKAQSKSGSYTQETPHVLVEKQKEQLHACYSAPNSHIPALWMTLLCSMMQENYVRNYGKEWFDDTTMIIIESTMVVSSSSCHQTCIFHLSTHCFAISLKLLR